MFSASLHATMATEMLCMVLRVSALAIVPRVARREADAPEFARRCWTPLIPRAGAQRARASQGIFHRQKKPRDGDR